MGYIRDLSSLTEGDVQALQFLGDVFKDPIRQRPEMDDPNEFTMLMGSYLRGIAAISVHHDDFYSRCSAIDRIRFGDRSGVQSNENGT